jgi:hypothetical protein
MMAMGPCIMVTHWPMTLAKEPKSTKFRPGGAGFNGSLGKRPEELQTDEDGRADRAERYGEGVEDQADDRGGQGREAQGQEQRSRQCRRRAEAGRTFDESREHVADDDGLDALVTADVLHPVLDGFHATRVLQGVQDDDGAKDDDEHADGDDDALQRKCGHVADGQVPRTDGAERTHKPCERHGFRRRPAHADHEYESNKNRQQSHHCQDRN